MGGGTLLEGAARRLAVVLGTETITPTGTSRNWEQEVGDMYQIYAMLGLIVMTWGAAMWASNSEERG